MKNAGYEVGVYSYSYWLNNYMEILRLPADYSLWGADYGTNNNGQIPSDLDKYSKTYDIWQFTDKAQIDGINGYVDINPPVNTFLFNTFFKSSLFSIIGKTDKKACSCLKYALRVCNPLLCKSPSNLLIKYSNSFKFVENVVI